MSNLKQLQKRLNYQFQNSELLQLALTHRSFSGNNNERLEFLGDSVLGVVIAQYLFKYYPDAREGDMSRIRSQLVRAESLAMIAKNLELGGHLNLGLGELKSGGHNRDSILGDSVEALIGAIFLDGGFQSAQQVIIEWFKDLLEDKTILEPQKDPKTTLQEMLQQRGHSLPDYQLIETEGADHMRIFTVQCTTELLNEPTVAKDTSRRKAEQKAATMHLEKIQART